MFQCLICNSLWNIRCHGQIDPITPTDRQICWLQEPPTSVVRPKIWRTCPMTNHELEWGDTYAAGLPFNWISI